MNKQPIEPILSYMQPLQVVEVFETIQGEGPYTGHRATFVRLAGCNLQCPGCDTDYTTGRHEISHRDLIHRIDNLPANLVVITGGEPFRQNISRLANWLVFNGYKVQVETNGTCPPSLELHKDVTVVCSPKTATLDSKMQRRINAFKYVLNYKSVDPVDGLPIEALNNKVDTRIARPPEGFTGDVYLQPMDCKSKNVNDRNIKSVVNSCLKHGYILQLQIHKIVGVE